MTDPKDLLLESYDFHLPKELIAERPAQGRHNSKLLVYNASTGEIIHETFKNISNYLPEEALLVVNQSKVFPCRLVGKKPSGGKCELFLLDPRPRDGVYRCLIKTRSKKKVGDVFIFDQNLVATLEKCDEGSFFVSFNKDSNELSQIMNEIGKIPIPPYIRGGESDRQDTSDYQTVYAKHIGSVAAPTAGLHFTKDVFSSLEKKNIERAHVTLHVGLGTFLPVKSDNILEHDMHTESYFVEEEDLEKIKSGRPIFAVGTTSLRVLESSHRNGEFSICADEMYDTNIFLYPGKEVNSISGLITNFHLPKSTLLMLVSTLVGRVKALELYQEAIDNEYRFFSYGDSMLIVR